MTRNFVKSENGDNEAPKKIGPNLTISNEQLPEIDDYSIDEDIELRIMAKITNITKPELKENEQKSVEPSRVTLKVVEIEILNQKEDRKKAENMNLEMSDYKKIQSKRKGGSQQ